MAQAPLAEALQALSRFLVADAPLGETLQRVADVSVAAVPRAAFAGIAMLDGEERATTGVYTDLRAPKIDQAQYDSGRGPCLDAWRRLEAVRLDDLRSEDAAPYPEFVEACLDEGIHSTLSMGLVAAETGIGALNLYATDTSAFSAADEQLVADLAVTASVVLANAAAYWGAHALGEQMGEAMRSRAVIEQAKGMLMAQSRDLTPEAAFDILRHASQRENVKLRDIAQRIVERRPLADPDES